MKLLGLEDQVSCAHLLQQVADADGGNQNSQGRGFPQRPVGHPFDHNAQYGTDDHRKYNGKNRVHPGSTEGEEYDVAADHDDIAVGEVQHFGNAVDHRVPQGDQRIHAPQTDAVDQVGQKLHCVKHLTLSLSAVYKAAHMQKYSI